MKSRFIKVIAVSALLSTSALAFTSCGNTEPVVTNNYAASISVTGEGTVTADKTSVKEGEKLTLTVTAKEGHDLKSITVDGTDKTSDVKDGKLEITVGKANPVVVAAFEEKTFTVKIEALEHGTITASKESALKGEVVEFSVVPEAGYYLSALTINDVDSLASVTDNKFSYTVASQDLVVKGTFAEEPLDTKVEELKAKLTKAAEVEKDASAIQGEITQTYFNEGKESSKTVTATEFNFYTNEEEGKYVIKKDTRTSSYNGTTQEPQVAKTKYAIFNDVGYAFATQYGRFNIASMDKDKMFTYNLTGAVNEIIGKVSFIKEEKTDKKDAKVTVTYDGSTISYSAKVFEVQWGANAYSETSASYTYDGNKATAMSFEIKKYTPDSVNYDQEKKEFSLVEEPKISNSINGNYTLKYETLGSEANPEYGAASSYFITSFGLELKDSTDKVITPSYGTNWVGLSVGKTYKLLFKDIKGGANYAQGDKISVTADDSAKATLSPLYDDKSVLIGYNFIPLAETVNLTAANVTNSATASAMFRASFAEVTTLTVVRYNPKNELMAGDTEVLYVRANLQEDGSYEKYASFNYGFQIRKKVSEGVYTYDEKDFGGTKIKYDRSNITYQFDYQFIAGTADGTYEVRAIKQDDTSIASDWVSFVVKKSTTMDFDSYLLNSTFETSFTPDVNPDVTFTKSTTDAGIYTMTYGKNSVELGVITGQANPTLQIRGAINMYGFDTSEGGTSASVIQFTGQLTYYESYQDGAASKCLVAQNSDILLVLTKKAAA